MLIAVCYLEHQYFILLALIRYSPSYLWRRGMDKFCWKKFKKMYILPSKQRNHMHTTKNYLNLYELKNTTWIIFQIAKTETEWNKGAHATQSHTNHDLSL